MDGALCKGGSTGTSRDRLRAGCLATLVVSRLADEHVSEINRLRLIGMLKLLSGLVQPLPCIRVRLQQAREGNASIGTPLLRRDRAPRAARSKSKVGGSVWSHFQIFPGECVLRAHISE